MNQPSGPAAPASGDDKPKSFAALRHPGARMYLIGAALAMMADSIEHVISYWIIFQKFHSPALAGFAVISHWAPFLLFSFWAGALADRYDPRRVIQLGMVMFMIASAGWGLLFWLDVLEQWHAAVLLVIHGMAGVLWAPAAQLLIHDMVGGQQLQSAIRLMATFRTLGLLGGPAVGGALLIGLGPTAGILVNVLIYLPLTLWLWKAPYGPAVDGRAAERKAQPRSGFADIIPTIRRISGIPQVIGMTLLAGATSMIVGNAHQAQMPEFATDLGQGDAGMLYSVLLTASAAGALTAGLALESRGLLPARMRTAFILAIAWCAAMCGFALTGNYVVALCLLFTAGFLDLSFNSMTRTLAQIHAPPEIRGRVIGVYNMANLGLRSVSGMTVGIGGAAIGIHASLAMSAAVAMVVIIALFATLTMRGGVATEG
jgi:MFS family permease